MDKEALVERKNIGDKLEIRISVRERYIEDGISFYRNHKEILFIYILDNKIDYKFGKDYDENLAAMLLQNKYVVDAIDEVRNGDGLLCEKAYRIDVVPYYKAEQNLYRFLNGRVVFERIIKEMVELMGRVDKTNSTMLFDFDCNIDNVKAKLIQAMEIEAERELKKFARDRFFNKEEVIVSKYNKGADE